MHYIDFVASLITEDPDTTNCYVINESTAREIFNSTFNNREFVDYIIGKLIDKGGAKGIVDIIGKLRDGERQSLKMILKEALMWIGYPVTIGALIVSLGLPLIQTFILKSMLWFSIVEVRDQIEKRLADKNGESEDERAMLNQNFVDLN